MVQHQDAQNMSSNGSHIPVLIQEVIEGLSPIDGKVIVDGTFGAGGYSRYLLQAGAQVIGIDRDPAVAPFVKKLDNDFGSRFRFLPGQFGQLAALLAEAEIDEIDAVVLDIGVSSMQLDQGERGFSFMRDGPLDMRMEQHGVTAADLVNGLEARELSDLIFGFGEERRARALVNAIVTAREEAPLTTTKQLADLIEKTLGKGKPGKAHPATKTFQALRIAVNAEYNQLVHGLFDAEAKLPPGGKLAVVTFHSMEDRIVKRFLKPQTQQSRHMPLADEAPQCWRDISKPVRPSKKELADNPRARSATLRYATRNEVQARPFSMDGLGVPGMAKKQEVGAK
ncbi:16S rRNA (cytosine(1402)-N(4))-methyltransferase RsmH [Maritalea mediterranea]|uniref:Ribosomal RNA small subunit methyltransferase H n=1 Tax=Maritalea mediterranea TaxID=2909667 RepID=A0ABS9E7U0_9HYPH|nr:16S rRNA (cytosine(1402)-N(4))-methyltransferase RsmH [Maritalea mediterranea]MCF4098936.1 16S rRNA (cytosine(1402)-N(4))-methyltransferase RsmH [Maritalea mediterranea]